MERTPNVNVRWWTTILPMLKFPRYLYAREHDGTTEFVVRSRDNPLSERMSIVTSKDIQSWKVTSPSQVTRHGTTTRLSQNWPNLQTRNQAGFSGIGIGQSAFNQMICAMHVSCRDVKWTGTLAQSEREIEIFQTLRHRYTYGILCEENVCAEKNIFITPPTDMSFTRMYRQAYLTWSCNIHEATCKQACKHRSKRIGRLPNGSSGRFTVRSASVSVYPRFTRITIIRVYPLFPSLSPVVLSGYSVPTN